MKIEDSALIVIVGGSEKTIPLPTVTTDAKLKVWSVPTEYRSDGLFVAITAPGEVEEVPACDLAACHVLGELDIKADDSARLAAAKAAKLQEINGQFDVAAARLVAAYPGLEIQSWPHQVKEAEALAADPQAAAPLLTSIASARAMPVIELAARVREKASAYAAASGVLIGRRQVIEDMIEQASTLEDVAAISW